MQKKFIRNTIKCNCTPAKIRYNVLLRTQLPQHSTDTDTRGSTATSAPHLISIQKPKMFHISHLFWWRDVRIKSHFASKLLSVLYIHLSITTQGLLLSLVSFSIKPFFRRKESSLSIVRFDMPNSFANLVAVMSPSTLR